MTKTIFVLVLVLLNAFKFFNLGGGIVLGEPDEVTHAEIVANFSKSFWPEFSGGPWYYNLPLYPRLAHLISSFFTGQFTALRAVSCFFSLVLALAIFFYVRWRCSHRVILSEERSDESKDLSARLRTRSKTERLHSQEILLRLRRIRMTRGDMAGFAAALFWTLCPFAIYYSRVGVIEMTVTALCFLFLFSFDYALETRRKKWALLSGLFLALALLTKYTSLIFVFVALIFFVVLSLRQTLKSIEGHHPELDSGSWPSRFRNKFGMTKELKTIKLDIIPTIPLFITAAVFLPIAFVFYRHDPYLFKVHTMVNLISWEKFTGARIWVGENNLPPLIWPLVSKLGWWLSWPVFILAVIGTVSYFLSFWSLERPRRGSRKAIESSERRERKNAALRPRFYHPSMGSGFQNDNALLIVSFIVACFFILRRLPFYPRYFLPLVPFIVIFAGIGFEWVLSVILSGAKNPLSIVRGSFVARAPQDDEGKKTRYQANKIAIGLLLILCIVPILPTSLEAYKATNHNLIEDTGQYIKSQAKEENPWIFSNYWPHFFGQAANTSKATWLAESKDELQAFIPDEERTASEILEEEGGFVVLEELYSKALISSNKYRQEAHQWLLENYEPSYTISDPSPNFPHSKAEENRIEVFVVE